jgi:hypothetical protein
VGGGGNTIVYTKVRASSTVLYRFSLLLQSNVNAHMVSESVKSRALAKMQVRIVQKLPQDLRAINVIANAFGTRLLSF